SIQLLSLLLLSFFYMLPPPPRSTLFPYTTLFRSPRQRELVAFAAHVLREDRKVQLAASRHFEAVSLSGLAHAQRDVFAQFALEAVFDVARCDVLAFRTGERRVVDHPEHRHRRLVDRDRLETLRCVAVGEGLADLDVGESRHGHDLAGSRFVNFLTT